jgi:hypothetical protein
VQKLKPTNGCNFCGKDNPCQESWCPFTEEKVEKKTIDEWVGQNAFGLGCSISATLDTYGVSKKDREDCLRVIMTVIRQWEEDKND